MGRRDRLRASSRATADEAAKRRAGETIWRFAQHAVHHLGAFNGDPHPGNYRFDADGGVTFLDFGLVKRWTAGEWAQLEPSLDAIVVHRDPERAGRGDGGRRLPARPATGSTPQAVYDYVSAPYLPYLTDEFTFTRTFVRDALETGDRPQRPVRRR